MAIKDVEAVEHHGDDGRWRQTAASGRSGGLEWFECGERAGEGNVIELAKPLSHLSAPTGSCDARSHLLPCTEWSPMLHWGTGEEKRVDCGGIILRGVEAGGQWPLQSSPVYLTATTLSRCIVPPLSVYGPKSAST